MSVPHFDDCYFALRTQEIHNQVVRDIKGEGERLVAGNVAPPGAYSAYKMCRIAYQTFKQLLEREFGPSTGCRETLLRLTLESEQALLFGDAPRGEPSLRRQLEGLFAKTLPSSTSEESVPRGLPQKDTGQGSAFGTPQSPL